MATLSTAASQTSQTTHRKTKSTLLAPLDVTHQVSSGLPFEASVHLLPRTVAAEVAFILPTVQAPTGLVAVLTAQKSLYELVEWGDEVAKEKDALLERFVAWAGKLCQLLMGQGYFADYIDPCSGLPANTDGNKIYGEVDGFQALLGYHTQNANCCKILLHPKWGSAVYPATLFTNAPGHLVSELVQHLDSDEAVAAVLHTHGQGRTAAAKAVTGECEGDPGAPVLAPTKTLVGENLDSKLVIEGNHTATVFMRNNEAEWEEWRTYEANFGTFDNATFTLVHKARKGNLSQEVQQNVVADFDSNTFTIEGGGGWIEE